MIPAARQAVLLVGGRGTRLGEHTRSVPKPLMELDKGRVFLDELIEHVVRHGYDEILLLAGHMADQFEQRYDGARCHDSRIRVLTEAEPAGTGGALKLARDELEDRFLFANGDTFFDTNLRSLDATMTASSEAVAAMALRRVEDAGRYGSVSLDGHKVTGFAEKILASHSAVGLINAGACLFSRSILDHIPEGPASIEADVYPVLAAKGLLAGVELDGYFIDIGLPETLHEARAILPRRRQRPTLFLDRDGVLNLDRGYTHKVEDLKLVEGIATLIRGANEVGALVIVVTNQAGVARGLYGLEDVDRFHAAIQDALVERGAHVDGFYVCPFHVDAVQECWRHEDHPDRKPNPGMILRAMREWPVDPKFSVLVGDQESDIAAATAAGIPSFLVQNESLAEVIDPVLEFLQKGANRRYERG